MAGSPSLLGIIIILYFVIESKKSAKEVSTIQYDCKDKKRFFILAFVFSVFTIVFLVISMLPIFKKVNIILDIIVIAGIPFFLFSAFLTWIVYADVWMYFKRLEKHGYEIPKDKKVYSGKLQNLPKVASTQSGNREVSYESILLAFLGLLVAIGILTNVVSFFLQYRQTGMEWIGVWGQLPCILFWFLQSLFWWKQRQCLIYKDDVELDENRKPRKHLISGLIKILICLFITLVWSAVLYDVADYMYKARVANNKF